MSVKSGQSGLTSGQRGAWIQAQIKQAAADEDLGELWDAELNEKALKPLAGKKVVFFEVPQDFDPSYLDGLQMSLGAPTAQNIETEDGHIFKLESAPENVQKYLSKQTTQLFPSKTSSGKLLFKRNKEKKVVKLIKVSRVASESKLAKDNIVLPRIVSEC